MFHTFASATGFKSFDGGMITMVIRVSGYAAQRLKGEQATFGVVPSCLY